MNSTALAAVTPRMNDGQIWHAFIDYNAVTHVLEVRTAPSAVRPAQPKLTTTVDIRAQMGRDSVYIGFTSGTGSAVHDHDIRSWTFVSY